MTDSPAASSAASAPDAADLADRLHDAQVAWVMSELDGERFAEAVAQDVDRVLDLAAGLRLGDVVAVADVQAVARRIVLDVATSRMVEDLAGPEAAAVHGVLAAEETALGDVVAREDVDALVSQAVALHEVRDRVLDRLADSPATVALTSGLVSRIVTDVLTQNRARAEKVPGVSSLLSLGSGAVSKVGKVSVGGSQLDRLLGDAVGAGAQFTMRRTTAIVRELVTDATLHEVAMELWDLAAAQPVGELVSVLDEDEVVDLTVRLRALVAGVLAGGLDEGLVARVVDACVATFFEVHADHDLAALLPAIGLEREDLVADVRRLAPPVLDALRADGRLEEAVRARLAPFWSSDAVSDLLRGGAS